uniref:Uncharacterized protein n=1 Tax=Globisporangium ultimum (strain ATCC 200006 / CBS 805.95 / DAOM BR144) TaxID=431595 RepID=K3W6W5_GLOUD
MEEMAAMLNEYAGGLQQSFSTVFDRVGQSLAQSAQMMQMMNDVMEAALLQNLRLEHAFDPAARELHATIENCSQILLGEITLSVYVDGSNAAEADAQACVSSQSFTSFGPGDQHIVRVPIQAEQVAGRCELTFKSPGTHAPLHKSCPFRISLFQTVQFEAVRRENVRIHPSTQCTSAKVALHRLRDVLRLSPLDAMVTADAGSYRVAVHEQGDARLQRAFFLSISRSSDGAGSEVAVAAEHNSDEAMHDTDALRLQCDALLRELEELMK